MDALESHTVEPDARGQRCDGSQRPKTHHPFIGGTGAETQKQGYKDHPSADLKLRIAEHLAFIGTGQPTQTRHAKAPNKPQGSDGKHKRGSSAKNRFHIETRNDEAYREIDEIE